MNKKTLVWTLIVAVPVGLAALATAYFYRDTSKLTFQEAAETASAAKDDKVAGQSGAVVAAPESSSEEETAQAENPVEPQDVAKGPSFDVVGVEPTGETVVAGRSDAGAIVALTANGKVVGKSIANEAGEWTIILDEPLKPGDYDVGLEVHDEAGDPVATSEERLAVSLPEGGKEQPLVVLNSPDGPSDILQKPEQQVAAAEPVQEPEQQAAATATAPATETASEETVVASAPQEAGQPQQQAGAEGATSAAEAQGGATSPSTGDTPAVATAETDGGVSEEGPAQAASTEIAPQSSASDTQVAAASETSSDPAQTGQQQASQSTPEADTGSETQVATRSAEPSAAAGKGGETVAAATEQTSSQETQTPANNQAVTETTSGSAPEGQTSPSEPTVTVEAVESEKDKVFVAGTGEPGSSVRVYVGDEFQGEAKINASGKWLIQGTKNIAEGNVEVRADLIAEDGDVVDARAAVTFEKEKDQQIVLTKVVASGASSDASGQGAEVKKTLPVVIIRKGDNLWRISRRLYGDGVRYTTIYQANQDQIRNPDLIYPGQVFLTPEGDLNWQQPAENNG